MSLPEFNIAIWVVPHRSYGYYVEIDASDVDDGLPGGALQGFQHVEVQQRIPELQRDFQFRAFKVSGPQVEQLVRMADNVSYTFGEHLYTPRAGSASFGLRMIRRFQEATLVWHGRFQDQDPGVCELYAMVESLAHVDFQAGASDSAI
jgi:hypothetical protein